ncbi:hypothetical protein BCV72DRAFT_246715 [Rhizopus microsporus var. microsporus]|uniref:BZIP domain-containing protein n=2 Tax=Rhizopus microsporus TaxID=58291 RepID=A0A2G4SYS8_RHIZD|nr:uncharacterized protein RHIMIDRAFT_250121 [Rhizopus microsporus ATCC 52813]ORE11674.1 hypothetical protein BCV72DRAFT_246715 [Rhizopus microsporus var. microsporus]PHZ13929.1 hypothetical protein RHIMIDRAFT_250121 [Rhizopus microsporus ATCC 52813]
MTEEISQKPAPFRPIAPSIPKILPLATSTNITDYKKRKWDEILDDSKGITDQRLRRKEQNRAAQRAFRERKERYVKELEDKIRELCAAHALEVAQLRKEIQDLRSQLEDKKKPEQERKSSAVACIRDKDGVSFCERLKEEVCSNAYNQLLTEPLFDSEGCLIETVADHPVPIVTTSITKKNEIFDQLEQSLFESLVEADKPLLEESCNLISCSEVWKKLQDHPLFEKFNLEELCDLLKTKAMCSQSGPVFSECDIKDILKKIESKVQ